MTLGLWLRYVFITALVLGFSWYALWQARFILAGPQITLQTELLPPQTERRIYIKGQADNIVALTLNGRPITTSETGQFEEALILENGYTIMSLEATDRYGRTTEIIKPLVYVATTTSTANES